MGRYSGTLHKLIDSASSANSKTKWNQVLTYIEGRTVAKNEGDPDFDSPFTSPTYELERELYDKQGPRREDFPLKIAVRAAPANIVAVLCNLGPRAATMADTRGRLPIHWACRRSADDPETEKVLRILATCNPDSLVSRDDGGRTPLHWLFWFHAPSRSPSIVRCFCQRIHANKWRTLKRAKTTSDGYPLPEIPTPSEKNQIPQSPVILTDFRHGALALHYAVMQGASKEAIVTLIQMYPSSLAAGDRQGRTALAWYLGAGYLIDDNKHICGEPNDPNATPWWKIELSAQMVQLLVNSKVARAIDDLGRTPLHWACHFLSRRTHALNDSSFSMRLFQILEDQNIGAVTTKDAQGKTPLHVLFDVVRDLQEHDYKRQISSRSPRYNIDLRKGGPVAFSPPKELIEILLKAPDSIGRDAKTSASYVEDNSGFLPLHAALRVATAPEIIKMLIKSNPTALVHTSEELLQTPIVQAFCSAYTAPLQLTETFELLMAAYHTSRRGTYMDGRMDGRLDGRLALKMEDAIKTYPLHYACKNEASVEIIRLFIDKLPRCALLQDGEGDLPIHSLLSREHLFEPPENGIVRGASLTKPIGLLTGKEVAWQAKVRESHLDKIKILLRYMIFPEQLKVASSAHGMTPLHIAVAFNVASYEMIYRMLDAYPEGAGLITTAEGYNFSCLDLHQLHQKESEADEQWEATQELLFSFYPLLDNYRKKDEILDACVKLIRDEITGKGGFHFQMFRDLKMKSSFSIDLKETLSSMAVPEIDSAHRPQRKKQAEAKPSAPLEQKVKVEIKASDPFQETLSKVMQAAPVQDVQETFSTFMQAASRAINPGTGESTSDANLEGGYPVHGTISKVMSAASRAINTPSGPVEPVVESIYDADLDTDYVVSPQNSDDDEDFHSSEDEDSEFVGPGKSSEQFSTPGSFWNKSISSDPSGDSTARGKKAKSSPSYVEEKKEEMSKDGLASGSPEKSDTPFLSEVAMRIWCFFVLFNDPKNPEDSYIKQVEAILEDMKFDVVDRMMNIPLPGYAHNYLEKGFITKGVTISEVASPKVRAWFHNYHLFLGKYDFSTEAESVLLHRSRDSSTVLIRANEHIFRTKEFRPGTELAAGAAEEAIWNTGEKIIEEKGYMASKFEVLERPVYFKLTKNQFAFENEVNCRLQMRSSSHDGAQTHVTPLINSYCATNDDKKSKRYRKDVVDERFQTLSLYGGDSICFSDYPYALVYPYCDGGNLFDYFCNHGLDGVSEAADIGSQICKALKEMHENGVVHGNISMQNIGMLPASGESTTTHRIWAVSDLTNACQMQNSTYMGGISHNGSAQFETGLMPPEMFVKLTPGEASMYLAYWEKVEKVYNIKVDRSVIEPVVDIESGSTFVLRCHYMPKDDKATLGALPKLPYQLVPARESTDVWCLGLIMFALCSDGRPLFYTNMRTGQILDYQDISKWDKRAAESEIYQHIEDPLAQDFLLRLLAPYEDRVQLTMEAVLNHPFLAGSGHDSSLIVKMVDKRQRESAAHARWRNQCVSEKSLNDWLKTRTTHVNCWDFNMNKKINFSSSEIVRKAVGKNTAALAMPCGFILLPYKLSAKNKKAKLAPTTKKDVERAERMGVLLLALGKACHFAVRAKDAIEQSQEKQWTATKLLESLKLPDGSFDSLKDELTKLAAKNIEPFRVDPMFVVQKLVERRILEIRACFKEAGKAFFYLVDEMGGIPLSTSSSSPYPLQIPANSVELFLTTALPFMHACALFVRGFSRGISGVVRLIFEAAYPHVPPSWAHAASGLSHNLDEDLFIKEILILHKCLASSSSLADDLKFIRDACLRVDPQASFANMLRVECAGSALWTTPEGASEIQEACQAYGFKQAVEIQTALEMRLRAQELQIKKLQEDLATVNFRKKHNLDVPKDSKTGGWFG